MLPSKGTAMNYLIGAIIAVLGVLLGWAIYDEVKAEKFYLRKDSWHCTANHVETTMIPIYNGNSTTYVPQVHSVCDQWSRNGG